VDEAIDRGGGSADDGADEIDLSAVGAGAVGRGDEDDRGSVGADEDLDGGGGAAPESIDGDG
jgi:hypothetical protein